VFQFIQINQHRLDCKALLFCIPGRLICAQPASNNLTTPFNKTSKNYLPHFRTVSPFLRHGNEQHLVGAQDPAVMATNLPIRRKNGIWCTATSPPLHHAFKQLFVVKRQQKKADLAVGFKGSSKTET
jgi:hypothetical protein